MVVVQLDQIGDIKMAEVDVSKEKNKDKDKNKPKKPDTTTKKPDKVRDVQKLRTPIKIPMFGNKMDKFQQGQLKINELSSRFDKAAKKQLGSAMKPSSASSGILQKIKKDIKKSREAVVKQQQQKKKPKSNKPSFTQEIKKRISKSGMGNLMIGSRIKQGLTQGLTGGGGGAYRTVQKLKGMFNI